LRPPDERNSLRDRGSGRPQRVAQVQKPILAVAELIGNPVDADADRVTITLQDDQLGGISAIEVSDNGRGIPHQDAAKLFSRLGGSCKQGGRQSLEKHLTSRQPARK
jgi:signal transduction histidine kinase